MKNKKKVYIDTYESIYPILLVVANEYATAKDLNKYFRWGDGEDILDTEIGNSDDTKQEPFCYYLEWITKCIYTTMSKK